MKTGMGRVILLILAACFVFLVGTSAWGAVIRVKPDGNDLLDGSTWALAKKTVQAGLIAASPTDEVWVAGDSDHPYLERITLTLGVGLYGGFMGTETARGERDWTTNVTVLDGGGGGTVVTPPLGATATTRIDGFTIRNGNSYSGGGIYCSQSSPTIANNTISGNVASQGGAIYCYQSSAAITNNAISGNSASYGGGICCDSSAATITSNIISGNSSSSGFGGGIYCASVGSPTIASNVIAGNTGLYGGGVACINAHSPALVNNTITANGADYEGGGIYCYQSSPTIANSIVAFNASGICSQYGGDPVLRYNCVHNPDGYNYSGLLPGMGDIQVDPLFVNRGAGDYHITISSPCLNAGDDSMVQPGWTDMDGEARIQLGRVDIGADEFRDRTPPVLECVDYRIYIEEPTRASGVRCFGICSVVRSVSDDWDPAPVVVQSPPAGTCLLPGTYAVTVTATDDSGNTADCTATAVMTDLSTMVPLTSAGWHIIAQPHQGNHALRDAPEVIMVSKDGGPPVAFCDAVLNGWLQSPLYYYDDSPTGGGYLNAGCDPWDDDSLREAKGYWLMTYEPNLTLVFP